ncbi:FMN-dependent NADH-azoreductase [Rhodobacter sphaeroides]|jgi:Acyl carrier protein phosphodiesterase|uniref:FMN-dependent NADH:quinone oxidoreductase n=1 Tax=Cereibacter sphaeroides (strain ATCC 17023 / DSM 158 / JCM 6121 / CCUG 31486 / LMG 2827 / NBRC 12203 / NCIMB 8253 / ATH 2.4.1.) TaxID=272943 RepID=AZOR_CERS4|nr:NAD(P)H-dependent oxidoreductase [Cereibacter sphaeroides]Q3IVU8.1 RecName: Full=FMN-dependent NADH:quinone oxidoreductase; AltName: Full=Azo-dye reductase; AltName: Full=FMN-dependent NADH-azo compound oxidoreductase; AltName: Full=FMN-dependent NADH-azoreductase [Cereibacter sphaeroides 2.4.1]ABA81336.1 putative acyl carrier protein phosphodiesterase [Cereibacter sphaeroides 2.4.1]AMJ49629.1 FMN-dependent NADH-azoreductase [Cereibacter sphaeroides]ANS36343.1 FMN-dependent NADH-azoreductase
MTTILRIDSSIKGEAAVSRRLTQRILDRLLEAHPDATVVSRDLAQGIRQIDGPWLGSVFTAPEQRTADQQEIARTAGAVMAEVKEADILVIALPVYNFGAPAQLKSWVDHIARRGESFVYTETGPVGLLTGKRAIVAFTSDGTPLGSELDHASGWLRQVLGFVGITDVDFVAADRMVFGADEAMARAEAAVAALAA